MDNLIKLAGVLEDEMTALERQLAPTSASLLSIGDGRKVNFISSKIYHNL